MRVRTILAATALAATVTLGGAGLATADDSPQPQGAAVGHPGIVAHHAPRPHSSSTPAPAASAPSAALPAATGNAGIPCAPGPCPGSTC